MCVLKWGLAEMSNLQTLCISLIFHLLISVSTDERIDEKKMKILQLLYSRGIQTMMHLCVKAVLRFVLLDEDWRHSCHQHHHLQMSSCCFPKS